MKFKIDKEKLFKELKKRVEKEISITERTFDNALQGFKDAPGFMESASDTTRAEKDHLMRIYKEKLEELKKGLLDLEELTSVNSDIIKEGSLVICDNKEIYWIVNVGVGENIKIDNKEIKTISSGSPLGQVFIGKKQGDTVEFRKKIKIVEIG